MNHVRLLFICLMICASTIVLSKPRPDLPYHVSENQIKQLRTLVDPALQRHLEQRLKSNKIWARLFAKKKLAVGVVDMADSNNIRFARINGDVMLYAASLPKLAILLAAVDAQEKGILAETSEIDEDMRQMISHSSNAAASRMIDRVSFEYIASVLQRPEYELYDPKRGGGLWVGKAYGREERRYPDPLMGISHGATVTQVCRFYYLLSLGKLVNRERSKQMLEYLRNPEIHHKFVYTYDHVVPDAVLYRKSGTWKQWHSDSVLIWGPDWRRYILVALVEDSNGEQILRNLIPEVESVLKAKAQTVVK